MMKASRRLRRMAKSRAKLDVQKVLEEIMNNASMKSSKKKEVLTSSYRGQVHFCNLTEYQISHSFQICEIFNDCNILHISYS